MSTPSYGPGIEITGRITPEFAQILTPEAVAFVAKLQRAFGGRRDELLARARRAPGASSTPASCRTSCRKRRRSATPTGRARRSAADMLDRRVEITGPTDRKMVINALNSGANVFMADFEDANSPTWDNMIEGQINLRDAVRRRIDFTSPEGKEYKLNDKTAVLIVRPRGWHLPEKHVLVDGEPVSGGIFDFALYFFHNAKELLARGSGPYFYLPKMESHLEARLWNDIFVMAQDELGVPHGHDQGHGADRDAARGVRDGRDPVRAARPLGGPQLRPLGLHLLLHQEIPEQQGFLPRRPRAGDDDHAFPARYAELLIKTCHRRNVHAMGGMAAQIPIKNDGGQRGGVRESARRQGARSDRRPRRHLGRAPGPRADRAWKCSTGTCRRRTRSRRSSATT